jgi:NADH-quinone oxidoreductase subunit L
MGKGGRNAAIIAVCAIGLAALLSFASLGIWLSHHFPTVAHGDHHAAEGSHADGHHGDGATPASGEHSDARPATEALRLVRGQAPESPATPPAAASHSDAAGHAAIGAGNHAHGEQGHDEHAHAAAPAFYSGDFRVPGLGTPWVLGRFGDLRLSISYYIDALTVSMFCMVTFIATLIHIYAMGYMHDELHDITDHEVTVSSGQHLHRPGRYHRFFQYLSLFCFSMLGLVVAGNIAMVFVFWELVGACSYFLIGFYVERKSASTAANKAFITNRVGDFGMIIGLMPDASGRVLSSLCMSGCLTRWKARRPSPPWCTRRRWLRPVSTWSDVSIRFSPRKCCW